MKGIVRSTRGRSKRNQAPDTRPLTEVCVASRVFAPEPAAASFRLQAVVEALAKDGCDVSVLTTTWRGFTSAPLAGVRVERWPVLRDKTGYVRGYLPYLSFDIPLFFRLLFSHRSDVVLVEPPPTTGVMVRLATAVRRTPYVWYAADVWSDATRIAGAPKIVVAAVKAMERFAVGGAGGIIAVSEGVAERVRLLGGKNVEVVPNGIDTDTYRPETVPPTEEELSALGVTGPYFLYAGTASEWQGARIFAEAMEKVAAEGSDAQLLYVGQGSEWGDLGKKAQDLKEEFGRDVVVLAPAMAPQDVARLLVGARYALVSIVPGKGYDFAYPTKVLAALAAGTPVLYAGRGPAASDLMENTLGRRVPYEVARIAEALLEEPEGSDAARTRRAAWVEANRSLAASGRAAAKFVLEVAKREKR